MRYPWIVAACLVAAAPFAFADWTEFRGTGGTSVAKASLPNEWSDQNNLAWKVDLPGRGLSGPIVVGDQVIITASDPGPGGRLRVLAYDVETGALHWERQFWATGNLSCHPKMCMATPTPATDGEHILAFYSSNDLACLDLAGNVRWYRGLTHDYPNASNSVGMSSSPVIAGGVAVVSVESEGDSFLAGLDMATGENLWKVPRPRSSQYSSPIALRDITSEGDLILTQSTDGVFLRRPKTGEVVWKIDRSCSVVPSATVVDNIVYAPINGIVAAKLEPTAAETDILWESTRLRAGTASPICDGGRVYALSGAILTCGSAETGEPLWKLRLTGSFSSTPVIVDKRMIAFSEDGVGFVIELGDAEGTILARNILGASKDDPNVGETILCSPAVAGDALYVRSDQHLWKIAQSK